MANYKPSIGTAIGRWAAIGPYYAMFPLDFAFQVIEERSSPGQVIIDPFAGRASSIYAAATHGRYGLGIEVGTLGWVYAQAKLSPAPLAEVEKRLASLTKVAPDYTSRSQQLPQFFHWCYSPKVLSFLLAARSMLNWRDDAVDRTLAAFLLVYLHGKLGAALSNQMRQTKSMGPAYSVRWWQSRNMQPPDIEYHDFMLSRIRWRYAKGLPKLARSTVVLGDSTEVFQDKAEEFFAATGRQCSLLFTSPPYCGITHYHKDQWLRLWLLGGQEQPSWTSEKYKGRFESKADYQKLLQDVFCIAASHMAEDSTVYVRTSAREFTLDTTRSVLKDAFGGWNEELIESPVVGKTQTDIHGNRSNEQGEVDIILTRSKRRKLIAG